MVDIVDQENGIYVDRLTVVYHAVEDLTVEPASTVVLVVDAGISLNRDELRRQIERLHWIRGTDGQLQHQSFRSRDQYDHINWGAAAAHLEIVIEVGKWVGSGIVGTGAWEGLKRIYRRIESATGPPFVPAVLDDQVAIRRAKQMAAANFKDVDPSGLSVSSVYVIDGKATVVMRRFDGSVCTVQLEMFDYGAIGPITRVYSQAD